MIRNHHSPPNTSQKIVALIHELKKGVDSYTADDLLRVSTKYFELVNLCECTKNMSLKELVCHSCNLIVDRYDTSHMPFCECCQTKVFLDDLGRYLEARNHVSLTKAKIRDRAFGFQINGDKLRFKIIRHLNAFHEDRITSEIVQMWQFDFSDLSFEEIEIVDEELISSQKLNDYV
jgi:hypothetical protein